MTLTPPLKIGDLIDVVAPGSAAPTEAIQKGINVLKSWGLEVRVPENLIEASTFFSNTDRERLKYLRQALNAKDSKAVWFVRGGSGTHRILPALFKGPKPKVPKLIVGFSDATSLLVGANRHWKWPTLHAPVLTQLGSGELAREDIEELRKYLMGEIKTLDFQHLTALNKPAEKLKGGFRSEILGGNLTVFQNLIGLGDSPRVAGKILFFEEINERGYRIDRTLTHLRQAGFFDQVKAVIFGDFLGGDEPAPAGQLTPVNRVQWAIENFANESKFPVFRGLEVGHGKRNRAVAFGVPVVLKAKSLSISSVWAQPLTKSKTKKKGLRANKLT